MFLHIFYVLFHGMYLMCLLVSIYLLAAFEIKAPLVATAILKLKSSDSTLLVD